MVMNLIWVDEVLRRMRVAVLRKMIAGGQVIVVIGMIIIQTDARLVRAHTLIGGLLMMSDQHNGRTAATGLIELLEVGMLSIVGRGAG